MMNPPELAPAGDCYTYRKEGEIKSKRERVCVCVKERDRFRSIRKEI